MGRGNARFDSASPVRDNRGSCYPVGLALGPPSIGKRHADRRLVPKVCGEEMLLIFQHVAEAALLDKAPLGSLQGCSLPAGRNPHPGSLALRLIEGTRLAVNANRGLPSTTPVQRPQRPA